MVCLKNRPYFTDADSQKIADTYQFRLIGTSLTVCLLFCFLWQTINDTFLDERSYSIQNVYYQTVMHYSAYRDID